MTGTWPSGWATGDIETAAEFKKGIGSISDTTLGGSAANIDISSIVGTYAHLFVVVYARGDVAAGSPALWVRFNGDTAANYDYQQLQSTAATVNASESFGVTAITAGLFPGNSAGANLFGVCIGFIPHYAGSSNNKMALATSAFKTGVATGNLVNQLNGGSWRSNAAINRITLLPNSGNFVAGTRVTLYGMGA